MTFTSGKRAEIGMPPANHDPEPWRSRTTFERYPEPDAAPERVLTWGMDLAPRAKFDVLDNPILADFRANHVRKQIGTPKLAVSWGRALSGGVDWARESGRKGDPQQIIHARRVLSKLAALA